MHAVLLCFFGPQPTPRSSAGGDERFAQVELDMYRYAGEDWVKSPAQGAGDCYADAVTHMVCWMPLQFS